MAGNYRRTEDSHKRQLAALENVTGIAIEPTTSDEADLISVAGDTTVTHNHYHPPTGSAAAMPTAAKSLAAKALPALLAATLGAGGFGAALFAWRHWPAASSPATPADSEYEVRFYDKDGQPITVPPLSQRPH